MTKIIAGAEKKEKYYAMQTRQESATMQLPPDEFSCPESKARMELPFLQTIRPNVV